MAETIFSTTADEYVTKSSGVAWSVAQGNATTDGDAYNSIATNFNYGVYAKNSGSRGTHDFDCNRSFFEFDLSGESGTVESANIMIRMDNLGSSSYDADKAILVEATALDNSVADHGNVFSSGTTWHNDISDVVTISTTAGPHTFTMNSEGIRLIDDAVGAGNVTVGLVSWYHDYSGNAPNAGGEYSQFQVAYSEFLGTLNDPRVIITYAAVAAADNATFFGANF